MNFGTVSVYIWLSNELANVDWFNHKQNWMIWMGNLIVYKFSIEPVFFFPFFFCCATIFYLISWFINKMMTWLIAFSFGFQRTKIQIDGIGFRQLPCPNRGVYWKHIVGNCKSISPLNEVFIFIFCVYTTISLTHTHTQSMYSENKLSQFSSFRKHCVLWVMGPKEQEKKKLESQMNWYIGSQAMETMLNDRAYQMSAA